MTTTERRFKLSGEILTETQLIDRLLAEGAIGNKDSDVDSIIRYIRTMDGIKIPEVKDFTAVIPAHPNNIFVRSTEGSIYLKVDGEWSSVSERQRLLLIKLLQQ